MKAIVYHEYGPPDVLELIDVDKPILKNGEVLVRVLGAAVNPSDWYLLGGTPYLLRIGTGLSKPRNKVLGLAIAGRVETVGSNLSRLQPGNEAYAGISKGGFAEYACVPEDALALKPSNLTFEQAAADKSEDLLSWLSSSKPGRSHRSSTERTGWTRPPRRSATAERDPPEEKS